MNILNESNMRLRALVVDDEATNRVVLKKLLNRLNYDIVEAENGAEAIEKFKETSPDIIFMDVMMPIMNGHVATQEIKKLCVNDFVPVIFLTALSGADEFKKCVDAGGDDFLSKPFDMLALNSKIIAMERIRKLYLHLKLLNSQLNNDDQFARKLFTEAIFKKNETVGAIKSCFETGERFNNDFLLTSFTPACGLNILFGHFNLRGTASAVGALPTSEVFRSMTLKGFSPHEIVDTINQKIHNLLPESINLQAIFIHINQEVNVLNYVNFGMPDAFILSSVNNSISNSLIQTDTCLGLSDRLESKDLFKNVSISHGDRIVLSRSNLFEKNNTEKMLNSSLDFKQIIESSASEKNFIESVKFRVYENIKNDALDKHLSLIDILCVPELTPENPIIEAPATNSNNKQQKVENFDNALTFELCIQNEQLKHVDPVPILLNFIGSIICVEKNQDTLFTIFTEFYANALDHGILKLDSSLKSSPEGFFNYFIEKENRLKTIESGKIVIKLSLLIDSNKNSLKIEFADSGQGFDYHHIVNESFLPKNCYSGRGYLLIKYLCEYLEFQDPGNQVTAVFSWHN